MMWSIPAKTFLLGEYVALIGGPALVCTTEPCFRLSLSTDMNRNDIHPDSPAGKWWSKHGSPEVGIVWEDPYSGLGGFGASTAQFLGVFTATHFLAGQGYSEQELLHAYYECAWNQEGTKPSGYDLLAQAKGSGLFFIEKTSNSVESLSWPFADIGFLLIHTGHKLATHQHLARLQLSEIPAELCNHVLSARDSLKTVNSLQFVESINAFHLALKNLNLITPHTESMVDELTKYKGILAAKGCGALGSDVILLIVEQKHLVSMHEKLQTRGFKVIFNSSSFPNSLF